ncbi:MAG: chitobiase/beta-hexosaminidase C-terminal domain-containing protein, partial [Anaerolineales bacterium]
MPTPPPSPTLTPQPTADLRAIVAEAGQGVTAGSAESGAFRFSRDSQVSNQPFQLTLTNLTGGTVRFTTDGALPNANSTPYQGPIDVNQTTIIRAQAFDAAGNPVGDSYTKSYLMVDYAQTIPVVSIVADWGDLDTLHSNATQRGSDWERPINLEYFEPGGQPGFNVKAGVRIHGGRSRILSPKKSYRIYFRKSYGGPGMLKYPLFEDSLVTEFDKLVLRAGYNDSFTYLDEAFAPTVQSTGAVYIRDQVVRNLHREMGQPIAHGNWVLLYLNGQFWGLYNL